METDDVDGEEDDSQCGFLKSKWDDTSENKLGNLRVFSILYFFAIVTEFFTLPVLSPLGRYK